MQATVFTKFEFQGNFLNSKLQIFAYLVLGNCVPFRPDAYKRSNHFYKKSYLKIIWYFLANDNAKNL